MQILCSKLPVAAVVLVMAPDLEYMAVMLIGLRVLQEVMVLHRL